MENKMLFFIAITSLISIWWRLGGDGVGGDNGNGGVCGCDLHIVMRDRWKNPCTIPIFVKMFLCVFFILFCVFRKKNIKKNM